MMDAKRFAWCAYALMVFLLLSGRATAGTTGILSGHVFDDDGRAITGATVQLITLRDPFELNRDIAMGTHEVQTRSTSTSGFFVYLSLEPGYYQIRTTVPGKFFVCPPRVVIFADQTSYIQLFVLSDYVVTQCDDSVYFGPQ